jgi:DNA polymerase-3 subunit gamma/tau
MSYQALYRKFRPRRFCDVIGQDHITTILKNQVRAGQFAHAYLFSGSRELEKQA